MIRDGDWIICQYWFFYAFNNWRSAFGGVNEHEADWEQVTVYLDGTGEVDAAGLPAPRWVVFSAHDETGDDLRRRWDDPDLTVVDGRHPVVYAGAGSHSGAYLPGDYLITVPSPTLGGLVVAIRRIARLLFPWSRGVRDGLAIPYVDYARGDGRRIGPREDDAWHPVVIDADTGWVRDFRGLWGHDTRDRLGGERGPAGPRYERDGTVRQSWADPVGWAGLAKVSPNPTAECADISARIEQADERLSQMETEICAARRSLRLTAAGLPPEAPEVRDLAGEERRVLGLTIEATRLRDERARMAASLTTPQHPGPPHAHLRHRRLPLEPVHGARNRLLASWAIISTPVMLLAASAVATPSGTVSATNVALVWLVILVSLEGLLRGKFLSVLLRMFLATAVVVGLYYLVADWRVVLHWTRLALGWGLFAAAALLLTVNIRDALKR